MKSFASGNLSSKSFRELALDYGISYRSDLLSKLGSKSKHNRLLYSVSGARAERADGHGHT
jgi:hypothetical protein